MDFNAIWAQIEPYVTWFLSTGVGGFLTYFLARLLARKWFKANDVDNFISNVVNGISGKTMNLDITAYTTKQLAAMEATLKNSVMAEQQAVREQMNNICKVLIDLSEIYQKRMITQEDQDRLKVDSEGLKTAGTETKMESMKIVLEPAAASEDKPSMVNFD